MFAECPRRYWNRIFVKYIQRIFCEHLDNSWIFSNVLSGMFAEYSLNILKRIFGFSIRGTFSEHSGNIQTDELAAVFC